MLYSQHIETGGPRNDRKESCGSSCRKGCGKKKKKLRKKVKRVLRLTLLGVCLLGTGYFLGVHHRVLEAMIKGKKPPKAPAGHWLHKA